MSDEEAIDQEPSSSRSTSTQLLTNLTPGARPISPEELFHNRFIQPDMAPWEASAHGVADGFSFGFNDELQGFSAAAQEGPRGIARFTDGEGSFFGDLGGTLWDTITVGTPMFRGGIESIVGYTPAQERAAENARDSRRVAFDQAQAEHPYFTAGGQVLGSLLSSFLTGGTSAAPATMRNAAIINGVASSLHGLGSGETTEERLRNMVVDGTIGSVAGPVGHLARLPAGAAVDHLGRRFSRSVPQRVRDAAEEAADVGVSEGVSRQLSEWLPYNRMDEPAPHIQIPDGLADEYQQRVPKPHTPSQFTPITPFSTPKPPPLSIPAWLPPVVKPDEPQRPIPDPVPSPIGTALAPTVPNPVPSPVGPVIPTPLQPMASASPLMMSAASRAAAAPKLRSRISPVPGAMMKSARNNPVMQQLGSMAQGRPNMGGAGRMAAMGTMGTGGGGRFGGHVANSVSNLMGMRAGQPVFNTPSAMFQKQANALRANINGHQAARSGQSVGAGKPRNPSPVSNHAAKQNSSDPILGGFFSGGKGKTGGVGGYYGNGSGGGFTWG